MLLLTIVVEKRKRYLNGIQCQFVMRDGAKMIYVGKEEVP